MSAVRRLLVLVGQSQAQIVIVGTVGYAEPWHDAVTEGHVVVEDLLEARILVAELFVDFVGGLEGGIHDVARESLENGAAGNTAAQGSRLVRVVVAYHFAAGSARGDVDTRLILPGQFDVGRVIDVQPLGRAHGRTPVTNAQ